MDSVEDTAEAVGCPIRKSTDQSLLAAPHGLSQRAASFIASQCQGIHQMPFRRLISSALTRRVSRHIRMRHAQEKAHKELATSPQPHPAKMHHHDPTDCLLLRGDGPVGSSSVTYSLHMSKIPYPPQRISVFSLADIDQAGSSKVTVRHCPSSWWRRTGSNRRPHACKARALPTELRPHGEGSGGTVVGQGRLELPTSRLSSARSNQLSY
jgi:hypothetical protein